jgi:hypothetical protein
MVLKSIIFQLIDEKIIFPYFDYKYLFYILEIKIEINCNFYMWIVKNSAITFKIFKNLNQTEIII